jgi:hypothetical protein
MYSAPRPPPRPLPGRFLADPIVIGTETEESEYTEDELVQLDDRSALEPGNTIGSENAEANAVSRSNVPQPQRHRKSVKRQDDKSAQEQTQTRGKDSTSRSTERHVIPKLALPRCRFAMLLNWHCIALVVSVLSFLLVSLVSLVSRQQ